MTGVSLPDRLRQLAADMRLDERRDLLLEAADALAPPEHGAFNCRGDYRLPNGDKAKIMPPVATCGLCSYEGPRLSSRCPECSERW